VRKVISFWAKVLLRSLSTTLKFIKEHVVVALILLVSLALASYFSTGGIIDQAIVQGYLNDVSSSIRFLAGLFLIAVVWFLLNIVYQPAKMYDELGGFAKRKMRVLFECKPRRYSEAWAGLRIYNDHPRLSITQCYTYFKEIVNLSDGSNVLKRPGEKLTWTNSDPPINGDKDIRPLGNRHPDILKTDNVNNRIIFCTQGNPDLYSDKAGIGSYRIVIGVWGVFEGTAFDEEVEFILNYQGSWEIECKPIREIHVG
jgi:hypothetical protein